MKVVTRFSARLLAVALLCFGPLAFGQGSASFNVTSVGNNVMNGIYVGPYTATVNGSSMSIICDDFADDTYNGESWTATVTTVSNLTGTKWGNNKSLYDEAGYFATQMMSLESNPQGNSQTIGYLSYVIWALFDAKDVKNWLYSQGLQGINTWNAIQGYLASAGNYANFTPPSNFFIFTPNTKNPITCNGGPCPTSGPPQEFIGFLTVAEGGSALLYMLFAGLACGAAVMLRRPAGANQPV
jgi:hypothetical protein